MRATPLLFLLVAALAPAAGCSSRDCTPVACLEGVDVTLTGAALAFAADLPVTLEACVGSACSSFSLEKTGAAPLCAAQNGAASLCTIDNMGTVVLTALPFPAGTAAGASVAVHVTATDGTGPALFDGTQPATVTASQLGASACQPTCETAEASFTP